MAKTIDGVKRIQQLLGSVDTLLVLVGAGEDVGDCDGSGCSWGGNEGRLRVAMCEQEQ